MSEILEGQMLEIENIMSFRGIINQNELDEIGEDMESKVNQAGAKRAGHPITITYGIGKDGMADVELLLPISHRIDNIEKYIYKDRIKIVNALVARHKGNPSEIQRTYDAMNQYISCNNLVPITAGYNITKKFDEVNTDNTEIDIYVGISPNVL